MTEQDRGFKYYLKALNPLIWLWNYFKYCSHIETYRNGEYKSYDFDKNDTRYF